MGLKGYILRRIIYMFILLLCVITVNFIIFSLLPGDPVRAYVQGLKRVDKERYQQLLAYYGLDKPLHIRYLKTVKDLLTFNFGVTYANGEPVTKVILSHLENTLILLGLSTIISIIIGILLGVVAAYKRGGMLDTALVTGSLITYSVPIFFVGWLVILVFSIYLGWFPSGFIQPPEWARNPPSNILEIIVGRLRHLVLPTITLVLFTTGGWILLTRACILETITEDYVVTARAKGLKERTVLYKHVLKNASLPLITNIALSFAFIISGAIITETLFSYEGMGLLTWRSLRSASGGADLPVLQAVFYVTALCVIVANFIADLLYGVIDPRVRYG